MANYHLIALPSTLLFDQAGEALTEFKHLLAEGLLQEEVGMLGALAYAYTSFYQNLGSPRVITPPWEGPPFAQDWNQYQRSLHGDLRVLYTQIHALTATVHTALPQAVAQNRLLADGLRALSGRLGGFTPVKTAQSGRVSYTIADAFHDSSKMDVSRSTVLLAPGYLSLPITGLDDLTSHVTVHVEDQYMKMALGNRSVEGASNGFPGNLHEVMVAESLIPTTPLGSAASRVADRQASVAVGPASTQLIAFIGDSNLHASPHAMLDGNLDTWFEYEVCNIPDILKYNPCAGYGFTLEVPGEGTTLQVPWYAFHEPDQSPDPPAFFPPPPSTRHASRLLADVDPHGQFIGVQTAYDPTSLPGNSASLNQASQSAPQQGGTLRLVLVATLRPPGWLTEVQITPHVLHNKRPTITAVQALDTKTGVWVHATELLPAAPRVTSAYDLLPPLETPDIWLLPRLHASHVQITIEQSQSYQTDIGHIVWYEATNAPSSPQHLARALGLGADPGGGQRANGPTLALSAILHHEAGVFECLDRHTASSALTGPVVEVFPGWRYAIALSELRFRQTHYGTSGLFASKTFTVPVDIKQVSLQTQELVPHPGGKWITYEICVDGTSWYPIVPPAHFTSATPRSYAVNPLGGGGPAIMTPDYDPVLRPVRQIALRATLTRGATPSQTPRLVGYRLVLEGIPQ